jgi:hypothetical protein
MDKEVKILIAGLKYYGVRAVLRTCLPWRFSKFPFFSEEAALICVDFQ